ncbi:hypothetical protein B0T16DRAFT_460131 [Cercophora newfieldiana]|uniref:F-box domain-containing protein n=1 Tax=Cercophora newfieldiana TaxID=92897 RepID=A0AA40CM47_9PEZI|nr:hypothetical protein B0T16DRAFT_460131 [Cercophora newfieldiana]
MESINTFLSEKEPTTGMTGSEPQPAAAKNTLYGLPEELLEKILEYAVADDNAEQDSGCRSFKKEFPVLWNLHEFRRVARLPLVGRRFYRLAMPMIYREVAFKAGGPCDRQAQLLRSLTEAKLGDHVKTLILDVRPRGCDFADSVVGDGRLVSVMSGATALNVLMSTDPDERQDMLEAVGAVIRGLPLLGEMELGMSDREFSFPLREVCEQLNGAVGSLRKLVWRGATCEGFRLFRTGPGGLEERSFPVTDLSLFNLIGGLSELEDLVKWLARLQRFTLRDSRPRHSPQGWTLSQIANILSAHKSTLEALDLCGMDGRQGLSGLDLRGFARLESLELSRWSTGVHPGQVTSILGAPRLRRFCWMFEHRSDGYFMNTGTMLHFGDTEETFVRALIATAVEVSSPLMHIDIECRPNRKQLWCRDEHLNRISWSEQYGWPVVYPWDRLERLRSEAKAVGIDLAFPGPTISRAEFAEFERGQRGGTRRRRAHGSPDCR